MLCIIQPYFLPFLGYFQLINKCDVAVIFDDVKFQKKGYSVKTKYDDKISISINIQNRSKQELIYQKKISKEYYFNIQKLKKSILQTNPIFFDELFFDELFFLPEDRSYFNFIFKQIKIICNKLKINTKILSKDNHRPCVPTPLSQKLGFPTPNNKPICETIVPVCHVPTMPPSVQWQREDIISQY